MTQADDDRRELEARRAATRLRDEGYRDRSRRLLAEWARDVVGPAPAPIGGAREFALAAVGPGWYLHTPGRHFVGEELEEPGQAGVCVEVVRRRHDDLETGEVIEATSFRCLATWRVSRPWAVVDASEVDTHQLAGIDRRAAAVAVRWLVRPVAEGKGLLNAKERDSVVDAWRLAVALGM